MTLAPFRRRSRAPRRTRRGIYLLPSMFTVGNLFCGYACIVFAMRGDYLTAAPLIGVAMVLDMLDGRIARLTGATSAFGLEFDSLADVVSFGIAPAVLAFAWGLSPIGRLGWAAGFLYVAATAVRLARFNIQDGTTDRRYFVGLPSPAAAAVPAATVFAYPYGLEDPAQSLAALAMVLVPAFLMVSTLRFHSFKTIDLGWHRSYWGLIVIAAGLATIATHPQLMLLAMAYLYLLSGPTTWFLGRTRRRRSLPVAPQPERMFTRLSDPRPRERSG